MDLWRLVLCRGAQLDLSTRVVAYVPTAEGRRCRRRPLRRPEKCRDSNHGENAVARTGSETLVDVVARIHRPARRAICTAASTLLISGVADVDAAVVRITKTCGGGALRAPRPHRQLPTGRTSAIRVFGQLVLPRVNDSAACARAMLKVGGPLVGVVRVVTCGSWVVEGEAGRRGNGRRCMTLRTGSRHRTLIRRIQRPVVDCCTSSIVYFWPGSKSPMAAT